MNICLISQDYPNPIRKASYVFLQNFAWTAADLGHRVVVICPLNRLRKGNGKIPYHIEEKTIGGNQVDVFFPKYSCGWYSYRVKCDVIAAYTHKRFEKCVDNTIKREGLHPDALYAQFLDPAGTTVGRIKKKYNCKAIASFGESSFWTLSKAHIAKDIRDLNLLDGIESVSSENKRRLLEKGIQNNKTIVVLPNAVDPARYHKKDRYVAREKMGFDKDAFIVAFLGGFIERKGILRLEAAAKDIEGLQVAYAGAGPQRPTAKNTIFSNSIPPESVSDFLSAADIFVLPTTNEGCCNAIIEAMACGLPIISSALPFNDDILNDENSIRVDPYDIDAIREAILELKNNQTKREMMASASLKTAEGLSIKSRVNSVIEFILGI